MLCSTKLEAGEGSRRATSKFHLGFSSSFLKRDPKGHESKAEKTKKMITRIMINVRRLALRVATPSYESFINNVFRPLSIRIKSLWQETQPESSTKDEAFSSEIKESLNTGGLEQTGKMKSIDSKFDAWGCEIDPNVEVESIDPKFDAWGEEINISEASLKKVDTTESTIKIGSPAVKSGRWDD